jgi:ketosteroid isomerase-like protein
VGVKKTMLRHGLVLLSLVILSSSVVAQNTNSSTSTPRPRTTNTNRSPAPAPAPAPASSQPSLDQEKPSTTSAPPKPVAKKTAVANTTTPGSDAVVQTFNALLDGIRHANVDAVTGVYWKSPTLVLFNYNGTVTKGWEQMRKNRESSYPELKDVKLEVHDVSVQMLGRDGALVSCLWSQSQTYKGVPESVSGRMTLVFKRVGTTWKAIHLHTSTDTPNPAAVPPSEQTPKPSPSATP